MEPVSPYALAYDDDENDNDQGAPADKPEPAPLVSVGAATADRERLFSDDKGLSLAEIHARAECERRKPEIEAAAIKAVDKLSRCRARVLDKVNVEVDLRKARRRALREVAKARKQFERKRLIDGPVRQIPTWALVGGTLIGTGLEWFVDQGALEGLLYLPSTTTKIIALIPVVISVSTAHLYGKYAKRRHLAADDLLIGPHDMRFGKAMAVIGLVTAVVIGVIRGMLGGPLSGLLFLVAAVGLWAAIAYMAYLWESPDESHLNRCQRKVRHLDRMILSTGKRKRGLHRHDLTARRQARAAAAGVLETVRHIFRVTFHHFEETLDPDIATPEWVKPYFHLAADQFPADLDLTTAQLDPELPADDEPALEDKGDVKAEGDTTDGSQPGGGPNSPPNPPTLAA